MNQVAAMASIPLLCNICPKQRKFSDISHLLTHVGSKGHLSRYFKLQVRSRQEPAAREQLGAYDRWYEKHEVERLLSERLTLKESKKANPRRRLEKYIVPVAHKRETTMSATRHRAGVLIDDDLLDPQLSQQHVKEERPRFAAASLPTTEAASKHRTHIPRMHLWPTARERIHETAKPLDEQPLPTMDSEDRTGSDDESCCNTPSVTFRTKSYYPDPSTVSSLQDAMLFDSGPSVVAADDAGSSHHEEMEDLDLISEGTKLKGVFWPGMDIFDSATPEMRRKRNQKKDGSILEKMMISAAEVEPTELVFTAEGNLKKQRRISGMVEDSSPVKEVTPKPKRRRSNPKKSTLTEISGNLPRIPRINRGAKLEHTGRRPRATELGEASRRALAVLEDPSATSTQSDSCRYMPTEDEDAEWRLTVGDLGCKKKHGFTIFEDPEHGAAASSSVTQGPEHIYQRPSYHGYGSQSFGHPQGLSLLSSEFHLPSADVTANAGFPAVGQDQKPITSLFRPIVAPPTSKDNKENIGPITNWSGRIDHQISLPGPGRKGQQYFSVEGAHPPHFFHTLPRHMEFGAFAGPEIYGAFSNPLTYTFQQPHPQQNNSRHLSKFHSFTSPYRRMTETSGLDASHHGHCGGANVGENEDEQMLFGETAG